MSKNYSSSECKRARCKQRQDQLAKAEERVAELELVLQEILQVEPLDVFGPMSDRMKRLAREALTQKQE